MTKDATEAHPFEGVFIHFGAIEDPRSKRTLKHELLPLLAMSLAGVLCGAEGWDDLEDFAESKEEWFKQFFELPHGTPRADTFRRVFEALDPVAFEECFRSWIGEVAKPFKGEGIAVDGKSLKGAIHRATESNPLHLVEVMATEQGLVLGQLEAKGGASGEPAAMLELLRKLNVKGGVITSDANGCTSAMTVATREAGANYVFALKGNRAAQLKVVEAAFAASPDANRVTHTQTNSGHGRKEARIVQAIDAVGWESPDWRDVKTFVMVERVRQSGDEKVSKETHFFISSLNANARELADKIRGHWGIENRLHWMLDVAFGEDAQRIRDRNSATNFAALNRLALMLVRNEKTHKKGARIKRKRAGWDSDYLALVMTRGLNPV